MEEQILFSERQKFNQWWLWVLIIVFNIIFLSQIFGLLNNERTASGKPTNTTMILICVGVNAIVFMLFIFSRLVTQIRPDGIYVKFFPFHLSFKHYPWETISKAYIRTYSPISEYGGWGLRYGIFGAGKAFNVSGDQGLQLEFLNHKKLLIGTQKPEELENALIKAGKVTA